MNTFKKQIWTYDPLYNTEVRLFIKDIFNLTCIQHQIIDGKTGTEKQVSVFYYGKTKRSMQLIDIIGIVRAIDIIKQKVIKYYLDDGTSTIACVAFAPEDKSFTQQRGDPTSSSGSSSICSTPQISSIIKNTKFNLTELVRVIGVINEFNQKREIKIRHMEKLEDPNEELLRWTEILYLKNHVYCREYNISHHQNPGREISLVKPTNKVHRNNISEYYSKKMKTSSVKPKDSETLKRRIKEYIKNNELNEFRFSRIIEVAELQQVAIKILHSKGGDGFNSEKKVNEEVRNLFKKTLRSLVQDEKYLQSDPNLISFKVIKG
ncbi:4117_t:CDS:2 [Funneliformis caledonium]|uniref:CST complex subunit STN1 n=2 Tax=Funneliformis TaxID=1117308 RepID=A0A9N8V8Q7_9GLOM|nr:11960_t:CDS:2 [Funneliformis mosseae]CAG8442325.1 4117_t:CDS:2 [Funneliformis caledonium]